MKLYHKEYGEGPPMVLLHGLLGSSENWHTIARFFEDTHHVVVPDLRNHGKSPHSAEFNYRLLASDLRELIDTLHLQNPVLVGHSMGGKTAMEFALEFPDIPRAIVVEDMVPGKSEGLAGNYIRMLLDLDLGPAVYRKDVEDQLLEKVADRRLALFLLKNLVRNKDKTFSWRSNLKALAENYKRLMNGLEPGRRWDGPALFIAGGRSGIMKVESPEEILEFFPHAQIATVENAGHWVHIDGTAEFLSYMREFLEASAG